MKGGKVFKMNSIDMVSNGIVNLSLNRVDFVAKTIVTGVETGATN